MKHAGSSLCFIRHAETALAGTFCGHSDPPLNARGEAQLAPLRARLKHILGGDDVHAIFSSDLLRARQTAESLRIPGGDSVQLRPALREIDFGEWETLRWEAIEQRDRTYAARWVAEFPALPAPGGETIAHFKHRVLLEMASLREAAQIGSIAVVTHGGVLRVLLEEIGHLSPHHAWERTREYTGVVWCTQQTADGHLEIHS